MQVYKEGITRTIKDKDWQKYRELGYAKVEPKAHKPEPMIVEEPKEEAKSKTVKKQGVGGAIPLFPQFKG